jgi:hypothetical protein
VTNVGRNTLPSNKLTIQLNVNLKAEIIKAYVLVCMTEVLKSK